MCYNPKMCGSYSLTCSPSQVDRMPCSYHSPRLQSSDDETGNFSRDPLRQASEKLPYLTDLQDHSADAILPLMFVEKAASAISVDQ